MNNKISTDLHNDCINMLSKPKQKILIDSVMYKLFNNNNEVNYKKYIEIKDEKIKEEKKISLYEKILLFCNCNIE